MSLTVVAHANTLDQSLIFSFFNSLPALESPLLASVRTVNEIQVDVSQAALFERSLNATLCRLVAVVRLKLEAVEDVRALNGAVGG